MSASETLKKRPESRRRRQPFFQNDAFWRGVASAFDLFGRNNRLLYYGRDPWQADYEALRGDWEAIGRDMEVVLRRFEREHAEELGQAGAQLGQGQQRLFDPDKKI